jgi:LmbE family N-acetylglucosaminyl deacetylase
MEDHMCASRLAVSAAFSRGVPNFASDPPLEHYSENITVYHAMPHGLRDQLRRRVRAGLYVNTASVHGAKLKALAAHQSQAHWLGETQGMGSYLQSMEDASRQVGRLSGCLELAEGWRRHSHLGFSSMDDDPLREALGGLCLLDSDYERSLDL